MPFSLPPQTLITSCIFLCSISLALIIWKECFSLLIDFAASLIRTSSINYVYEQTARLNISKQAGIHNIARKMIESDIQSFQTHYSSTLRKYYCGTVIFTCFTMAAIIITQTLPKLGMWGLAIPLFPYIFILIITAAVCNKAKNDLRIAIMEKFRFNLWAKRVQLYEMTFVPEIYDLPSDADFRKKALRDNGNTEE